MNARGITFQRLQAFCAVYEQGTFSAAARYLGVSQPTVSKYLRDLESAVKLSLFVLDSGRVVPTPEAAWLYSESRFLTEGLQSITRRINDYHVGKGQRLSAGCIGVLMQRHLPDALFTLRGMFPGIEISVRSLTALEQLANLRTGQIDVGFCGGLVEATELYHRKIGRGQLVLLTPQGHPLHARDAIAADELRNIKGLIYAATNRPIGRILAPYLSEPSAKSAPVTCYSLEAMPRLAQRLGLAAVVDSFTAAAIDKDSTLKSAPFDPPLHFDINAYAARPFAQLRLARKMTDAMEASLAEGTAAA